MTFRLSILAREITAAVGITSQIVDASGKIPILRATRIDVTACQLMATNGEQTVTVSVACEGEGVACIDTPALLAKVQTIKPDSIVEFNGDGKSVTIQQGRTRWTAPVLLDDFPAQLAEPLAGKAIDLSKEYIQAIGEAQGIIDPGHHMTGLTGVRLEPCRVLATDGKTLRFIGQTETIPRPIIIPGRIAAKLPALFPDGAVFRATETTASFTSDALTLFTRLVDGQFPDMDRAINGFSLPNTCTVKADDLLASLKRAGAINASGEKSLSFLNMRLTFKSTEIEVFCRNLDGEEGFDVCLAECSAEVEAGFSGQQLIDEIASMGADNLTIAYNDEKSPICISAGDSKRYVQTRVFR